METNLAEMTRSKSDYVSPAELRALLKSNLGLNARQVTVRQPHSRQYLTVTIRDASVSRAAVEAFARKFHTWTMDMSDYCEGQSIQVETTREVDDVHAAPHIEEIKMAVAKIMSGSCGCGTELSNGKYLWKQDQGFYVTRGLNSYERGCYIWPQDVISGAEYAIRALALQMARVGQVA